MATVYESAKQASDVAWEWNQKHREGKPEIKWTQIADVHRRFPEKGGGFLVETRNYRTDTHIKWL